MAEFLQDYGLWIALGGVFVAMHWFGTGCCGGHRHHRETGPADTSRSGAVSDGPDGTSGTSRREG